MIEPYNPYLEQLLRSEPWRAGAGVGTAPCTGTLDWDGSPHWICTCGRIGSSPFTLHLPIKPPGSAAKAFLRRFSQALQRRPPQAA